MNDMQGISSKRLREELNEMATGKYHFELDPPIIQFVKNPGNLNLEVKK